MNVIPDPSGWPASSEVHAAEVSGLLADCLIARSQNRTDAAWLSKFGKRLITMGSCPDANNPLRLTQNPVPGRSAAEIGAARSHPAEPRGNPRHRVLTAPFSECRQKKQRLRQAVRSANAPPGFETIQCRLFPRLERKRDSRTKPVGQHLPHLSADFWNHLFTTAKSGKLQLLQGEKARLLCFLNLRR